MRQLIKRAISSALFFFLYSCSKPGQSWNYQQTITPYPVYNSGKLSLYPQNDFRGLELEFIKGNSKMRMYLNIYCLSFPQEQNDSSKTLVTISTSNDTQEVLAHRFEGGQRLLLPDEAASNIICKLLNNQIITIAVGRYSSDIIPQGFAKNYFRLLKTHFAP
jgi:hypothetical protein